MSNVTKTYTELSTLPIGLGPGQYQIGKCSGVLDNHMQCWRSADILVTVITQTTVPAHVVHEDSGDTQIPEAVDEIVSSYQLCRRHAQLDQQAYESAKPTPEPVVVESTPVVAAKSVAASTSTFTPPPAKK